jgi:photosystem II stability/assembly factor-like uncharacterized protein
MKSLVLALTLCLLIFCNNKSLSQWAQVNGPYGGVINCVANNGPFYYAGTRLGVFRSSDYGLSWIHVGPDANINSLCIIIRHIFAATNIGVFLSTNLGIDWNPVNNGLSDTHISSLASLGTTIYAGNLAGVAKSTDYGTNWTQFYLNTNIANIAVCGNIVYASNKPKGGIFVSTNDGADWTKIMNGLTDDLNIGPFGVIGNCVFTATWHGVYRTVNNGANWALSSNGLGADAANISSFAALGDYIIAGSGNGIVYLSSNFGVNWKQVNIDSMKSRINSFTLNQNNNHMCAATDDGVFISRDSCFHWHPNNTGLYIVSLQTLTYFGNNIVAGISGLDHSGIFVSTDFGYSWTKITSMTNTNIWSFASKGNDLYAGGKGVFLSTDNGIDWTKLGTDSPGVTGLAISSNNYMFAAVGGSNGVWLSTDNGKNWAEVGELSLYGISIRTIAAYGTNIIAGSGGNGVFLSKNNGTTWIQYGMNNNSVNSLAASGNNIFAGTQGNGIYHSTDNGVNWAQSNNGLTGYVINALVFSGSNVFAGTNGDVFLSSDNGANWVPCNLPSDHVNALCVNGTDIYAATYSHGIWRRPLSDLVTPVELSSFKADNHNGLVTLNWSTATETNNRGFEIQRKSSTIDFTTIAFVKGVGTTTKLINYSWSEKQQPGIYSYRLKQLDYNGKFEYSKSVDVTVNPNTFTLNQNYPNPFNPTTTIEYSIPSPGHVSLKLYDLLGNEVASLVNENKPAGNYSVQFNGSKLTSGLYFYKLESGSYVDVKKFVLMK